MVILGQDPYINEGQAHGLAFSVQNGIAIPPSLKNIYKELESDLGIVQPKSGNLIKWAEQGVLLLNTILTVRAGASNSHEGRGWRTLTNEIIRYLGQKENIVFLLWGKNAQEKEWLIGSDNLILKAPHPSPLSAYRGFFGCKHFSKTNEFLESKSIIPINWQL